ncbi:MAG: hypothetical protein OEY44_03140 [Candidatus Peregrinibacteria bacterium]|nr:hypothetical protein [Candidatus Peregrinibacteria bacterium]
MPVGRADSCTGSMRVEGGGAGDPGTVSSFIINSTGDQATAVITTGSTVGIVSVLDVVCTGPGGTTTLNGAIGFVQE